MTERAEQDKSSVNDQVLGDQYCGYLSLLVIERSTRIRMAPCKLHKPARLVAPQVISDPA